MSVSTEVQGKEENALLNLIFNIVLPVIILNQLSKRLGDNGPLIALVTALLLPIAYGAYDYITRKKKNYLSLLGILNISVTGGFALLGLGGIWFAIKEAFFPLIIGVAVYFSNILDKPFIYTMFWNKRIFRTELIEAKLRERKCEDCLIALFRKATFLFSVSFFISSGLNFILANRIFTNIDSALSSTERTEILNQQIAKMTWMGHLIIAVPMTIFIAIVMWFTIQKLKKLSGLSLDEIINEG
ncbi:MAG: hypothetical protein A2Z20_09530 [Bdellovibrionales bacterium RBG_16_40_8]|nr:MAG: hypothetical protein A2Z20_09530 [Bdellovibrionales bacterium RBG_16_40_8]